jgi:hypothetical protein
VFRVGLGLFYPCLVGAALNGALSHRLALGPRSFYQLVSIQQCSAIHLSPPTLLIYAGDNLVSDGSGSAFAMSVQSGVGTGVEQQQIAIGNDATVVARTGGGPWVTDRRRTHILIRPRHRLKSRVGFSMGATGTSTSAGAERAEVKADEKVQTLLAEVLKRCDSILEALGSTGGGIVLGADGGINTVGTGSDATRDNVGAGDDDVSSVVLDAGTAVILVSDAAGGILTSTGGSATRRGMHGSVLTSAHRGRLCHTLARRCHTNRTCGRLGSRTSVA